MSRSLLAVFVLAGATLTVGCDEKKTDAPAAPAAPAAAPPAAADPAAAAPPTTAAAAPTPAPTAAPAAGGGTGSIKGSVTFTGKAPEMAPLKRDSDAFCAKTKMNDESAIVNKNGTLKNVLVRLTNVTGTFEAPKEPAVVSQEACMYRPRIQGVLAGQTVQIKNGDQTLHNVHTFKGTTTLFNQAQIPNGPAIEKKFSDGGAIIKFKCDVHPWMLGYVAVSAHPFFAVTGDDGSFELKDVPAGTYKIEAWHERFGTKTADVTVAANGAAETRLGFTDADKAN